MEPTEEKNKSPRLKKTILAIVFLFIFFNELLYVFIIPPWQNHDEPAHFSYTQYLVEEKALPNNVGAIEPKTLSYSMEYAISEQVTDATRMMDGQNKQFRLIHQRFQDVYLNYSNLAAQYQGAGRRPLIRAKTPEQYRDIYYRLPDNNLYRNSAAIYQPLYYSLEAIPYLIFYHSDIITRMYAMRVFSMLLFMATIIICYLLAMRLTRRFDFSITTILVIGLQPVFAHLMTGINNEALLAFLCTLTLYWLVRLIHDLDLKISIFLGLALGLGMLTKPQFIIFPLLAIIPYLYHFAISKRYKKSIIIKYFSVVVVLTIIISGWWFVWAFLNHNGIFFSSDAGEAVSTPAVVYPQLTIRSAINFYIERWIYAFASYNFAFGFSTEMILPSWVVVIDTLVAVLSVLGLSKFLFTSWKKRTIEAKTIALTLVGSCLALEAFFLYLFTRGLLAIGYARFPIDGRYYMPIIFSITILTIFGLRALIPARAHRVLYFCLVILSILINAVSIFSVVIPKFYL